MIQLGKRQNKKHWFLELLFDTVPRRIVQSTALPGERTCGLTRVVHSKIKGRTSSCRVDNIRLFLLRHQKSSSIASFSANRNFLFRHKVPEGMSTRRCHPSSASPDGAFSVIVLYHLSLPYNPLDEI